MSHKQDIEDDGPNPYADLVRGKPRDLVDFELATDPYAGMLPGISSIKGAGALGAAAQGTGWVKVFGILFVVLLIGVPLLLMLISLITGVSHPAPSPPLPPHA